MITGRQHALYTECMKRELEMQAKVGESNLWQLFTRAIGALLRADPKHSSAIVPIVADPNSLRMLDGAFRLLGM